MLNNVCPYCKQYINGNKKSFAAHVRWCTENPTYEDNLCKLKSTISKKRQTELDSKLGHIEKYIVKCNTCGNEFTIESRTKKFNKNKKYYCCRSCANKRHHTEETKLKITKSLKETYQKNITDNNFIKNYENSISTKKSKFFKDTYHTTWDGESVYLRSGFEQEYADFLDRQKIKYKVEFLKILYFDSKDEQFRIAIPDFFIPESNTIVEIKSRFTYIYENMKCKATEYLNKGYNFILILDHKEYKIHNIDDLPIQKQDFTINMLKI